ncbi:glycosyltransferase family 39 protein [Methanoregula sp.]|uniref:glycosyltransferase family 39 protein n=1 Tax=Methanoregula sp. TaxID=2052170 RepID=UPI003564C416
MTCMAFIRKNRAELALTAILLLSLLLNLWNLWNQGISNEYYAAAVKSMLENPRILFFNSFDAAGFVTVDKPPVGLWAQVASAALFGFSGLALVLPQALAGVGSVALVYLIVSRPFGKPAGLLSALALAVTPIFVAVSRNGTMDGLLIFVLLLSLFVALKAAREQSLPWLLVSVGLIGIGFNIKMIQAFIIVPAVLFLYLMGTRSLPLKTRALHLVLAVLVLLIISLSWTVAVDLIPPAERPYIGGSGDNTVFGLIINYNGIHRLENGMTGLGAGPGSAPQLGGMIPSQQDGSFGMQMPDNRTPTRTFDPASQVGRGPPDEGASPFMGSSLSNAPGAPVSAIRGPGGMMGDNGTPGLFRLLSEGLAGQISWLLPFALLGLLALWRRPASLSVEGVGDAGLFTDRGLTVTALCLWLVPGLLYFSFTTGFWHSYYLATIAPPLAALAGIGAVAMYTAYRGEGLPGWILIAAILITGIVQTWILLYDAEWSGALIPVVAFGTLVLTLVLAALKLRKTPRDGSLPRVAAGIAVALLFVAPTVWACTPMIYGSGNFLPSAGPQLDQGSGGRAGGVSLPGQGSSISQLAEYLESHTTGETWLVAVPSSHEAASLILETGKPVMALGGFSGSDSILSVENLTSLIHAGKVRYFYTPSTATGGDRTSGNSEIFTWVSSHCTAVSSSEYGGTGTTLTDDIKAMSGSITLDTRSATAGITPPSGSSGTMAGPQGTRNTLYDCAGAL